MGMQRVPSLVTAGAILALTMCFVLARPERTDAQQIFGSIYGTVTDTSGAPLVGARVTITDVEKGAKFDVLTNESGNYTKGQLIPGTYRVQIEMQGLAKVVSSDVAVQVDQAARFDAAMHVGTITEEVEVTAAAPLLQTDRADVAQTLSSKEISDLPNFSRNLQSFELLLPGTSEFGWQQNSAEDPQGGVMIQVNGQPFSATGYQLDGTVNQDPILGLILINPPIDGVNEVKQASQDYDAEFGLVSGGNLVYSTKSGSNAFHGSAFEFLYLNTPGFQDFARNPFNSAENTQVPPVKWNQFGGSLGGRVIKDKLFFFGDAQLTRRRQGSSVLTTVPTAAARTGDLSGYIVTNSDGTQSNLIYNPATGNPATGVGRLPFSYQGKLNVIPPSLLSPQALALMKYLPLPNTAEQGTGYDFRNNYATTGVDRIDANQWDTRWDYYSSSKDTYFGRYSYAGFSNIAPGAFGLLAGGPALNNINYGGDSNVLNQSLAAGWTHTQSATLINELRVGYMRYHVSAVPNGVGTSPAKDAGIPGLNLDNYFTSGMPAFFIYGDASTAGNDGAAANTRLGYALDINQCNCPLEQRERQYQVVDNLNKIAGNHSVKVGADIRYALNLRVPSDRHRSGELQFQPGYTGTVDASGNSTQGYGLATFLLGAVTNFQRYVSSSTDAEERQKRWAFYGQDEWRPYSKLTLTVGLRWELVFPETVNRSGNGGWVDLNTGLVSVMGIDSTSSHGLQSMNYHEFAPRLGVAYQLDPKTVLRAGSGWSYSLGTFGSTFGHAVTQNLPVLAIQDLNSSQTFSDVFTLAQGPGQPSFPTPDKNGQFPLPNGVEPRVRPAQMTLPLVMAYNATVQRQITNKISVSAAYVGNQGRHSLLASGPDFDPNTPAFIPGAPSLNAERPYYGWLKPFGLTQSMHYYCNCANNNYNSFQSTFKIQQFASYTAQGSFTYQVAKGDGYGDNGTYGFLYNRVLSWGNEDYIAHRQFTLTQSFDVPFGRGRKYGANISKWLDLALGQWNISGVTQYYSGMPFTPSIGTFPAAVNGQAYSRPNTGPSGRPNAGTGSPYTGAAGNRNQWFVGATVNALANGSAGAWALPGSDTFGNYAPNSLFGPRFINQDLSLAKSFAITERFRFTLRADAFNSFNHTNLGLPNSNITDPSAGLINGLANNYQMRRLQFSGRIQF